MNNFVLESLPHWEFRNLRYFTVRRNGAARNEFEDFLERMEAKGKNNSEIEKELDHMITWLERIAEDVRKPYTNGYFRFEGAASALPPPTFKAKAQNRFASEELGTGQMRLYCLPLNDHVVVLFNGDVKSPKVRAAQDCPAVGPHFKRANKLARSINEAFTAGDITWTKGRTDIHYERDLELEA